MRDGPLRSLWAAVATVLIGIVAGATGSCNGGPEEREARPPSANGMAVGFNETPSVRTFALQSRTGMPVVRFKVSWTAVEPAPDRWVWAPYDRAYAQMLRAGLRPLLVAIGGPCWTRPDRPCAPAPPDADFDSDWAEYVRKLVERYPDAVGVEVWNEPNSVLLFPPRPDPVRFEKLLAAAHDAVKEVDPGMPVVLGGLFASDRTGGYAIADQEFLAAVLAAGGGDEIDAIGAHPYPRTREPEAGPVRYDLSAMQRALDRLRSARDAFGYSELPIWITEVGVSTMSGARFPPGVSGAVQARVLLDALRIARDAGDVQLVLIHRLLDLEAGSATGPLAGVEAGFGVFGASGRAKPAACALSNRFGGSLTC